MGVPTKSEPTTRAGAIFFLIAGALLAHHLFIRLLSEQFHYDTDTLRQPILLFVSAQFLAGVIYLYLLRVIPQLVDSQAMVWSMIAFGLLFRLLFFDTEAILEIDFYRYLWDGGVLANGINPYLLAPAEVAVSGSEQLREIAASSEPILSRVHYSELRTIYPPLSQLAFALSYWVNAWSLDAWRMLILLAECSSLFILLKLLKAYGRSLLWASLYWWSPLVTKELINSAHMDALLVPFILGAVLLLHQHRLHRAIALIAVASGVKLWPMILAPFVFVRLLAQKSQLSIHAILFGCLLIVFRGAVVLLWPRRKFRV